MLLKIWALTLVFNMTQGTDGSALTTQKYFYTTAAECEVWRKFWQPRRNVAVAQCTNDYVVIPK